MLGNKHLIQYSKLISFLKDEDEHYKIILKDYDETKKSKILKNKISEYINNYYYHVKIRNEKNTIDNSEINFDTDKNKHNNDYIKISFFNYNNNSCWVDCFLFIYNNIIFQNYKDNKSSKLCLSDEIQNFFNDICIINNENTLYQEYGII